MLLCMETLLCFFLNDKISQKAKTNVTKQKQKIKIELSKWQ